MLLVMNFAVWLLLLLIRAGDIHLNPGPFDNDQSFSSSASSGTRQSIDFTKYLTIVHHNVQSLFPKIDEIYTEFKDFDIL